MGFYADIIADSVSPDGIRIVSQEVEYPHAVHKDIMTHGFVRNFKSFRATPPEILLQEIEDDPFIPSVFGRRAKGMTQDYNDTQIDQDQAREDWMNAMGLAVETAWKWLKNDVAKEQINFLLQDFCWIRGVITATEWDNFYGLRADSDNVRPEISRIARMMNVEHESHKPRPLDYGEWHLTYADDRDSLDWDYWLKISTGRTARISYATHRGVRDHYKDVDLYASLLSNGHMSPFGHQATPIPLSGEHKYIWRYIEDKKFKFNGPDWSAQFYGWAQHRKLIPYEENFREARTYHAKP
jgi:hypothetical protein